MHFPFCLLPSAFCLTSTSKFDVDQLTWHMRATGDEDGSHFTGRIIADSSLEDLRLYELEKNDRVEFVDNSHKIIEFDLQVGEKWTDGLSFKVTDGTSLFLDLENNNNISIKAGSNLQEINPSIVS